MRIRNFDRDNRLEEVQNDDRRKADETSQALVSDRRMRCRDGRHCVHDNRQFIPDGPFEFDASAILPSAGAGRDKGQRADYDQPQSRSV